MKQVIQHLGDGSLELADTPCPEAHPGHLLIRTSASLISAGTERMLIEFAKSGLISKARQQPERVRQTIDKVRADGWFETIEAVRRKLDQPMPLGYCNVGQVIEVGAGVDSFAVGDRVVSNGYHAEVVQVPKHLCAHVPDSVADEAAAFTVLGAVALQAVRLAAPTIGEIFVVSGLGLVGLLAAQILRANGCRVIGADLNAERLAIAEGLSVEAVDVSQTDLAAAAMEASEGAGIDGAIIAASTSSSEPVHQVAQVCRKRGRIVLAGVTGLQLSRADFYAKELSIQVSCSYGPGRYDPQYEIEGRDYPIGFVRWTEQRNFQAVLQMLAHHQVDTGPLITHRFALERAADAYEVVAGKVPSLGVLLEYRRAPDGRDVKARTIPIRPAQNAKPARSSERPVIAFVGPGNFASKVLLPGLKKSEARLKFAVSANGLSSATAARKFGFEYATTDLVEALADPDVTAVMVATRHDTHAALVCGALKAGKHVFVEKPLAIDERQLAEVQSAWIRARPGTVLMVGFNRRFAPQVRKAKSLLEAISSPKAVVMTVNAGAVASDHWTRDPKQSGGRIIGEACHFLDLLRFLVGHPVTDLRVLDLGSSPEKPAESASITLKFADGSVGAVHYFANGHRAYPKERLQVFVEGRVLELNNFRKLRGYGWPRFSRMNLWRQDKGHAAEMEAFLGAIKAGGPGPIPVDELFEVTRLSCAAAKGCV